MARIRLSAIVTASASPPQCTRRNPKRLPNSSAVKQRDIYQGLDVKSFRIDSVFDAVCQLVAHQRTRPGIVGTIAPLAIDHHQPFQDPPLCIPERKIFEQSPVPRFPARARLAPSAVARAELLIVRVPQVTFLCRHSQQSFGFIASWGRSRLAACAPPLAARAVRRSGESPWRRRGCPR